MESIFELLGNFLKWRSPTRPRNCGGQSCNFAVEREIENATIRNGIRAVDFAISSLPVVLASSAVGRSWRYGSTPDAVLATPFDCAHEINFTLLLLGLLPPPSWLPSCGALYEYPLPVARIHAAEVCTIN